MENLQKRYDKTNFGTRKLAWIADGKVVCRHGVFFKKLPANGCACMTAEQNPSAWTEAVWMPHLDWDLRAITVAPFDRVSFQRLGVLQAKLRRLKETNLVLSRSVHL